jgi:hypothetical protein
MLTLCLWSVSAVGSCLPCLFLSHCHSEFLFLSAAIWTARLTLYNFRNHMYHMKPHEPHEPHEQRLQLSTTLKIVLPVLFHNGILFANPCWAGRHYFFTAYPAISARASPGALALHANIHTHTHAHTQTYTHTYTNNSLMHSKTKLASADRNWEQSSCRSHGSRPTGVYASLGMCVYTCLYVYACVCSTLQAMYQYICWPLLSTRLPWLLSLS